MRSAAVGILCVRRGISHTRSRSWTATDRGLCFTPTLARRYFLYRGYSLQEKFENISSSALRYLCRAFEIRICCVTTSAVPPTPDLKLPFNPPDSGAMAVPNTHSCLGLSKEANSERSRRVISASTRDALEDRPLTRDVASASPDPLASSSAAACRKQQKKEKGQCQLVWPHYI